MAEGTELRSRLFEFEIGLHAGASEEVRSHEWGRAFLSPRLPLVWDANWVLIEATGVSAGEAIAFADEALSPFAHRKLVIADENEGLRLAGEIGERPGWGRETALYMAWEGESGREPRASVTETDLAGCAELRRELIRDGLPAGTERLGRTSEQLLEWARRLTAVGEDRWFVAPSERPASTCCLISRGGIGQIDDVATLPAARGRGYAQAVTLTALAASLAAGHEITFLTADAADWPRHLYEKLGFVTCGQLHALRRLPPT